MCYSVPDRYQMLSPVGSGAYGQVWFVFIFTFQFVIHDLMHNIFSNNSSAVDSRNENKVAIKKLARPFQSAIHAKRTYRELRLLKHMNHENVIGLLDVFTPGTSMSDFQVSMTFNILYYYFSINLLFNLII